MPVKGNLVEETCQREYDLVWNRGGGAQTSRGKGMRSWEKTGNPSALYNFDFPRCVDDICEKFSLFVRRRLPYCLRVAACVSFSIGHGIMA